MSLFKFKKEKKEKKRKKRKKINNSLFIQYYS